MGAAEEERLMKMFHLSHKLPFSSGKEWYIVSYGDINRINNRHTQSGHSNWSYTVKNIQSVQE